MYHLYTVKTYIKPMYRFIPCYVLHDIQFPLYGHAIYHCTISARDIGMISMDFLWVVHYLTNKLSTNILPIQFLIEQMYIIYRRQLHMLPVYIYIYVLLLLLDHVRNFTIFDELLWFGTDNRVYCCIKMVLIPLADISPNTQWTCFKYWI